MYFSLITFLYLLRRYAAEVLVTAGQWRMRTLDGIEQIRAVNKVIMHPRYSAETKENDVALLRLSTELVFNDYVTSVCLPLDTDIFVGKEVLVTGWGRRIASMWH